MKKCKQPNVFWKSMLRRKLLALLILIMVFLVCFFESTLFSEYLFINSEISRIEEQYKAIGYLSYTSEDPYYFDAEANNHAQEHLASSEYLDFADLRRYCSGVMRDYYNADEIGAFADTLSREYQFGIQNTDIYAYIEVTDKEYIGLQGVGRVRATLSGVTEGYPWIQAPERAGALGWWYFRPEWVGSSETIERLIDEIEVGKRYFVRSFFDVHYDNGRDIFSVKPLTEDGLFFIPAEPGETVDVSGPEYSGLRNNMAILHENQRNMMMAATVDMTSIPDFQESAGLYGLKEGRFINRGDHINANPVCVIPADLAEQSGIEVGEILSIKLRNTVGSIINGYIGDDIKEKWIDYQTSEAEFEVVGIYESIRDLGLFLPPIYMPDSLMPQGYNMVESGVFGLTDYSFTLRSVRDIEPFLSENTEALADIGIRINFLETSADTFIASSDTISQQTSRKLTLYSGLMAFVLVTSAFLYLMLNRRDFAILRALGNTRGQTRRRALIPIGAIGVAAALLSAFPAWNRARTSTMDILSEIPGYDPSAAGASGMSPIWIAAVSAGLLALLLLLVFLGTCIFERSAIVSLLQGSAKRAKQSKHEARADEKTVSYTQNTGGASQLHISAAFAIQTQSNSVRKPGVRLLMRDILRNISRTPAKTAVLLLLSCGLVIAADIQNQVIINSKAELDNVYKSITVRANVTSGNQLVNQTHIPRLFVDEILKSDFIRDSRLQVFYPLEKMEKDSPIPGEPPQLIQVSPVEGWPLIGTNTEDHFGLGRLGYQQTADLYIEYADGWDADLFGLSEGITPLVVPRDIMEEFSLELGDRLRLFPDTAMLRGHVIREGVICGVSGGGVSGKTSDILAPLAVVSDWLGKSGVYYVVAEFEFDPQVNMYLNEYIDELRALTGQYTGITLNVYDEELRFAAEPLEKTIGLFEVLLPVTVAFGCLLFIVLMLLMILQTKKEAACLRVLGHSRSIVRSALCLTHLLPVVVGLIIGAAISLMLWCEVSDIALLSAALSLAGSGISAVIAAVIVLAKPPLELLQAEG